MDELMKAMDSMDDLSASLKKLERYNYLFSFTGRMIFSVLLFLVIALFSYILVLESDFQSINPYLGTIRLSGASNFGTFIQVYDFVLLLGALGLYITTVNLNRRALMRRNWDIVPFDRTKGKDGLIGAIANIDWDKARKDLKGAKLSFVLYNITTVGVYSFLLFFAVYLVYFFVVGPLVFHSLQVLNISFTLTFGVMYIAISLTAVAIALWVLRKKIRSSIDELRDLDTILREMRWFLDEFEKSGFQA